MINTVNDSDRAVIAAYIASMQAGPGGLEPLVALFDEDAVYVEPFDRGRVSVHHAGRGEIRAFFEVALAQHLNGVRLTLDRLDVDGDRLRSEWTCEMPGLSSPMRGFDLVTLRDGRIARLETTVTEFNA